MEFDDIDDAFKEYEKKFKDKSGLAWVCKLLQRRLTM
jgi:hypothetical protein